MAKTLDGLSFEELTALNDEIIMLSKAGVPLEAGLLRYAKDGRGAANRVAERIATRLESGESLSESIRNEGGRFPEIYATVVESGVRSGRLPMSLEAISEFSREFTELRRGLFQAVLYPLITIIAAYFLFIVFLSRGISEIASYRQSMGTKTSTLFDAIAWLANHSGTWFWIPPALLVLAVILWAVTGRAGSFSLRGMNGIVMCLPGMSRVIRYFRHSMFARLASVLLQHDVPLSDALPLAASGCGHKLESAALAFAEADRAGSRHEVPESATRGMQPLLRWLLKREQSGASLITNLQMASRSYFEKGEVTLRWIRTSAPIMFTLFVGGGITALYAVSLFLPITDLMSAIAEEAL